MKALIPQFNKTTKRPTYLQLYDYIKEGIISNELMADEKLPSIRRLATEIKLSVTTINLAYQQLLVEGYIYSKPKSGYYISPITAFDESVTTIKDKPTPLAPQKNNDMPQIFPMQLTEDFDDVIAQDESPYLYDDEAFDFVKWKKSLAKVLNDHYDLLLSEGNPQGEYSLRYEIHKYLYQIRGIETRPEDIIIGAGTQQMAGQLSKLALMDGITDMVIENPGYVPAYNIFQDYGLNLHSANVDKDGISLDYIPRDRRLVIYTSPSNQFPTGAVMPAGKRYDLLFLAGENGSYIIEDDYDSELRYFGKPIPPLKSLDKNDSVIYLSSFSSTLFPAVKISYMVLPKRLSNIFHSMQGQYTQTCSKSEQLALAYYMEDGNYQSHVRKVRRLYTQKLQATINAFEKYAKNTVSLIHSSSGINMLIEVKSDKSAGRLCRIGKSLGVSMVPLENKTEDAMNDGIVKVTNNVTNNMGNNMVNNKNSRIILHFHRIPLDKIDSVIRELINSWL